MALFFCTACGQTYGRRGFCTRCDLPLMLGESQNAPQFLGDIYSVEERRGGPAYRLDSRAEAVRRVAIAVEQGWSLDRYIESVRWRRLGRDLTPSEVADLWAEAQLIAESSRLERG